MLTDLGITPTRSDIELAADPPLWRSFGHNV